MNEQEILELMLGCYNQGIDTCKEINFRKWTPAKTAKERAFLNKLFKKATGRKLTDEEYAKFNS